MSAFRVLQCIRCPRQYREVIEAFCEEHHLMPAPSVQHFCQTVMSRNDYDSFVTHLSLWGHIRMDGHILAADALCRRFLVGRTEHMEALLDALKAQPKRLRLQPSVVGSFNFCLLQPQVEIVLYDPFEFQ